MRSLTFKGQKHVEKTGRSSLCCFSPPALKRLKRCQNGSRAKRFVSTVSRAGVYLVRSRRDVREAGISFFTWDCLRHTFASRLVMAGVGLRTVAELMGHKTIQMTMRYAHLAPAHKLAAIERLAMGWQTDQPTDTKTSTETFDQASEV
jgi:integrase